MHVPLLRPASEEPREMATLIFRIFFSLIFILLGGEHLFRDNLIQQMIPHWMGSPRVWSVLTGLMILAGGGSILFGAFTRLGAWMLITFLVPVTLLVHVTSIGHYPDGLDERFRWLWDVYHQGSLVKNLSLIGGAIYFAFHGAGKFSVDRWLEGRGR